MAFMPVRGVDPGCGPKVRTTLSGEGGDLAVEAREPTEPPAPTPSLRHRPARRLHERRATRGWIAQRWFPVPRRLPLRFRPSTATISRRYPMRWYSRPTVMAVWLRQWWCLFEQPRRLGAIKLRQGDSIYLAHWPHTQDAQNRSNNTTIHSLHSPCPSLLEVMGKMTGLLLHCLLFWEKFFLFRGFNFCENCV
ncbi:surface protease GP63, putative [Trypanosoma cruzi]|nr:surface protease GP63, putative [Trypanosoma cruzi]